jgi:hypothetical protein
MKTNTGKMIFAVVFAVTLSAGVVAGLLAARLPSVVSHEKIIRASDSSLAGELGLGAEQRDAMRKIWIGVRDISQASYESAVKLKSEQDAAILALLPPEKVAAYNEIQRTYAEKDAALIGRRKAAFEKAVKETRKILSPSQRAKYDEILKKRGISDTELNHDPLDQPAT